MTRKEHLQFCSKCTNRKFNASVGLICSLTDQKANFEATCDHFNRDEKVLDKAPEEEEVKPILVTTSPEQIDSLPDEIKKALRAHQSIGFAILGGFLLVIISAILWAAITVAAQYQIAYMAIGVGLIVGYGIRFFGAGIDREFGILGGAFALLGCLLGNLFSNVGFVAQSEGLGYMEVLSFVNASNILDVLFESFSPMDLLFYGIAIYQGYRFSFRSLPSDLEKKELWVPAGTKLRMPLALISSLLIGFFLFSFTSGKTITKKYYHENGELSHYGNYTYGMQSGIWKYYTESGELAVEGEYLEGLETGIWKYFEEGELLKVEHYEKGLAHGPYISFYSPSVVLDSGNYVYGRMDGPWVRKYENGAVSQSGNFELDNPIGLWSYYYENGQLAQQGNYLDGIAMGDWREWDETGHTTEEYTYTLDNEIHWTNYWDKNKNHLVKNGEGHLTTYFDNGKMMTKGNIKKQKFDGTWHNYHENGQLAAEYIYVEGQKKVIKTFSPEGAQMVVNGNGIHQNYYPSGALLEEGSYVDGQMEGPWKVFYDGGNYVLLDQTDYKQDKMHGTTIKYNGQGFKEVMGQFENGKRSGTWTWYNEDESISSKVNFIDGKKDGEQKFYHTATGILLKTEVYKKGKYSHTELN